MNWFCTRFWRAGVLGSTPRLNVFSLSPWMKQDRGCPQNVQHCHCKKWFWRDELLVSPTKKLPPAQKKTVKIASLCHIAAATAKCTLHTHSGLTIQRLLFLFKKVKDGPRPKQNREKGTLWARQPVFWRAYAQIIREKARLCFQTTIRCIRCMRLRTNLCRLQGPSISLITCP